MMRRKATQHNSKTTPEKELLHPLQRSIILCLATSNPQTKNETAKAINGHYRSTWNAIDALKEKGLITENGLKTHHGREFQLFWLTELGILVALREGAKPETFLRKTRQIFPENEDLHFLVEAIPILAPNLLDPAYVTLMENREIELSDKISVLFAQALIGLSSDQKKRFNAVLKRYPKVNQLVADFVQNVQNVQKSLKELSDSL
jgi:hypothetical protein